MQQFKYLITKFLFLILVIFNPVTIVNAKVSKTQITNLQNKLLAENNKLSDVESNIKSIDQQIATQAITIKKINDELLKIVDQKSKLEQQKTDMLKTLDVSKTLLAKQLQTMYMLTKKNKLHTLSNLNSENVGQYHRLLTYIKIYNDYNQANIEQIKFSLNEIDKLNLELESLKVKQNRFKLDTTASHQTLQKLKEKNMMLKNKLADSVHSKTSKLDNLKNIANKLNEIIQSEISLSENVDYTELSTSTFAKSKGKLPTPVKGSIKIKHKDRSVKNTIFISAEEGVSVKAVFSGVVVFSNWLRGFGFLTIIDHGDNYMSLYGNNQALLKNAGDFVEAGEVIATTGSSGGANNSGLYFEIRHKGTSANTVAWLKKSNKIG